MSWREVKLVINYDVKKICVRPYPNHKKACPNFYKSRLICPPICPKIEKILNLSRKVFIIWTVYNFSDHAGKMRSRHPERSKRQVEYCLYWQETAKKALRAEISRFKSYYPTSHVLICPEASGVDITATMRSIDEFLEWPPITKTYQVALAGKRV